MSTPLYIIASIIIASYWYQIEMSKELKSIKHEISEIKKSLRELKESSWE